MNKSYVFYLMIAVCALFFYSCKNKAVLKGDNVTTQRILGDDYELAVAPEAKGLLVLFPCFSCDIENTKLEFDIEKKSLAQGISVLYMSDNAYLYMTEDQKQELATRLTHTIRTNQLPEDNIYIGGFSGGGNITMLISDYLMQHQEYIKPKGLFIVDSPIDLVALNRVARKNVELKLSESSVQESTWIIHHFNTAFGELPENIEKYYAFSPYVHENHTIDNLKHLKNLKMRMYTEPDTAWWYNKNQNEYEDLNAFYLKELVHDLKKAFQSDRIELIETSNKGYRTNGVKHPHSWSIVDHEKLLQWILE